MESTKWFIRQVVLRRGQRRCLVPFAADGGATVPTRRDGDAYSSRPSHAPRPHPPLANSPTAVPSEPVTAVFSITTRSSSGTPHLSAGTRTPSLGAPARTATRLWLGELVGCPGWRRPDPPRWATMPLPFPGSLPSCGHSAIRKGQSMLPPSLAGTLRRSSPCPAGRSRSPAAPVLLAPGRPVRLALLCALPADRGSSWLLPAPSHRGR